MMSSQSNLDVNDDTIKKESAIDVFESCESLDSYDTKGSTKTLSVEEKMKDNLKIFGKDVMTKSASISNALPILNQDAVLLKSKSLHKNIKNNTIENYRDLNESISTLNYKSKLKCSTTEKSKENPNVLKNVLPNIYIADVPVNLPYQDITKFIASCRFCRENFVSVVDCNNHKCSQSTKVFDKTVYKCKLCSLVFKHKIHLDKHLSAHSRNDCKICTVQLTTRKALHKHLKDVHNIHEVQKVYKCNFCGKAFVKKPSLHSHLKNHANGKLLCLKCGFMCAVEADFLNHMKEHRKAIKFKCTLCDKQFVRRQQFDQHMMGHKRHICSPCDVTFSTKKMLLKHQQSHHGVNAVKKIECPICQKLFFRPIHLKVHLRSHTGEKPVKCSHCEKNFSNEQSLAKHMKTARHLQIVNNGEKVEVLKPFLCATCGATFFRQQSLQRHTEMVHIPGNKFECPHCDYNTKCKANLKRHIEGHSNIKRYVCEICGASFRAFGTLKEHHAFVHSESRSFSCDTCNKAFKNKSSLQRHLRIHREDRPYRCHCNRDYKRLSHLKRHLIAAHHMTAKRSLGTKQIEICDVETDSNSNKATVMTVESPKDSILCNNVLNSHDQHYIVDIFESGVYNNEEQSPLLRNSDEENEYKFVPSKISVLRKNSPTLDFETTAIDSAISKSIVPCDSQDSVSLEDPNLNLSPNNFLNFSDLSTSPISIQQNAKSSTENTNRPRSLPNLDFKTPNVGSFYPFSMTNSDLPTSIPPTFLLDSELSTPSIEQNSSSNQLFDESRDILVLQNFDSNNESGNVEGSSENFFADSRNDDAWNPSKGNSKMLNIFQTTEISNDCYEKAQSSISEFPSNLNSSYSPLLACHLVFPDDPLMDCTIDTESFNTDEFMIS